MFLVCVCYPIAEYGDARERRITKAAGRRADRGGTTATHRTLEWTTEECDAAVELRKRLEKVAGVTATLREA